MQPQRPTDSSATIVKESRPQRDGLFGFLLIAFGFALYRLVTGPESARGQLILGVILTLVLVMLIAIWIQLLLHPDRLEVSIETIVYVAARAGTRTTINRANGIELRFVTELVGRSSILCLVQPSSDTTLRLQFFSKTKIREACETRGWQID